MLQKTFHSEGTWFWVISAVELRRRFSWLVASPYPSFSAFEQTLVVNEPQKKKTDGLAGFSC